MLRPSLLLLLSVLSGTLGCWLPDQAGTSCTLIGCPTGVIVYLDQPIEQAYRARLAFGDSTLEVSCPEAEATHPYPLGGGEVIESSGLDAEVRVTCNSAAVMLRDAIPEALTLEIVLDVGEPQTFELVPQYRDLECNGPMCGGTPLGEVGAGFELDPCRPAVWGPYRECVTDSRARATRMSCPSVEVCGTDGQAYAHICALDAFALVGTCPAAEPERCCS